MRHVQSELLYAFHGSKLSREILRICKSFCPNLRFDSRFGMCFSHGIQQVLQTSNAVNWFFSEVNWL